MRAAHGVGDLVSTQPAPLQPASPAAPPGSPAPTVHSGTGLYRGRKGAWTGALLIAAAAWLAVIGWEALSVGGGLWSASARQRRATAGPALLAAS
jgi:hypothetical protein